DAIVAVAIGVWILPRAWRLAGSAVRILIQAAPSGLDVGRLQTDLAAVPGVVDVHDLHVWTLTSDMDVASAHLMVSVGTDPHGVLDQARDVLRDVYDIAHATLQVEPDDHTGCAEVAWCGGCGDAGVWSTVRRASSRHADDGEPSPYSRLLVAVVLDRRPPRARRRLGVGRRREARRSRRRRPGRPRLRHPPRDVREAVRVGTPLRRARTGGASPRRARDPSRSVGIGGAAPRLHRRHGVGVGPRPPNRLRLLRRGWSVVRRRDQLPAGHRARRPLALPGAPG